VALVPTSAVNKVSPARHASFKVCTLLSPQFSVLVFPSGLSDTRINCNGISKSSTASYGDSCNFLYVDGVPIPQNTHLWASTVCYGGSCTFLYVRISQERHLWASTACYGVSFTFLYVDDVCTSLETRMGLHCLFRVSFTCYMYLMFVPHKKHTYGTPRSVTVMALLSYNVPRGFRKTWRYLDEVAN
jgi:hypothetical protein